MRLASRGSLNHLLGVYGVLSFSIGLLGTWSASNNAAHVC